MSSSPSEQLVADPDGAVAEAPEEPSPTRSSSPAAWWARTWVVVAGLTTIIAVVPLAVALGALRSSRWYPALDLAQTEMRVRDVFTRDTPKIGLPGRFDIEGPGPGGYETWQGSHPGPLSFYSLWPFYKLFGATAWALQAAAAALNVAAVGVSLWIGKRRGGPLLALGIAAALVVLMRAYGADKLTEAWNPYMPMMWWVVFLLAVWSVLCDDLPMLPVAVFAGSLCLQTHIPYLGIVSGVAVFTVLAVALLAWLAWRSRPTDGEGPGHPAFSRGRLWRWGGASGALFAFLWAPPVYEELTRSPGNMSVIAESFTTTEEARPSLGHALKVWLGHLDVRGPIDPSVLDAAAHRNALPGLVLLLAWTAAAALTAWAWWRGRSGRPAAPAALGRLYDPRLARLHVVVGVALGLGLVSISRITGLLWYYLMLWAWGTTALLLVAFGWTVARLALGTDGEDPDADRAASRAAPAAPRLATAGLAAFVLVATLAFTWDASSTTSPGEREAEMLDVLAPATMDALRSGDFPGGGEDGRYLVWWDFARGTDEVGLGGQAYGLFLELEREGFDVGTDERHAAGVGPHRVWDSDEAAAAIHYVVGPCIIDRWSNTPEATLVAQHDLRSPAELERFDEVRDELITELEASEVTAHLAGLVDRSLFGVAISEDLPSSLEPLIAELIDLSLPAAVFITPPEVIAPTADC